MAEEDGGRSGTGLHAGHKELYWPQQYIWKQQPDDRWFQAVKSGNHKCYPGVMGKNIADNKIFMHVYSLYLFWSQRNPFYLYRILNWN